MVIVSGIGGSVEDVVFSGWSVGVGVVVIDVTVFVVTGITAVAVSIIERLVRVVVNDAIGRPDMFVVARWIVGTIVVVVIRGSDRVIIDVLLGSRGVFVVIIAESGVLEVVTGAPVGSIIISEIVESVLVVVVLVIGFEVVAVVIVE